MVTLSTRRVRVVTYRVLAVVAVLAGWSVAASSIGGGAVPTIPETFQQLTVLFESGEIYPHLAATVELLATGFVLGLVISTATGVLLGWHEYLGEVFAPILYVFYAVPKLIFFPIFIAFFGLGQLVQVVYTTVTVALPTFFIIYSAMESINETHIKTAESMQIGPSTLFRKIVLPSIRLPFVTALRLGFSFAILNAVLIEMVLVPDNGLGAVLIESAQLNQVTTTLGVFVILVVISIAGVLAFRFVEQALAKELSKKEDAASNWTV